MPRDPPSKCQFLHMQEIRNLKATVAVDVVARCGNNGCHLCSVLIVAIERHIDNFSVGGTGHHLTVETAISQNFTENGHCLEKKPILGLDGDSSIFLHLYYGDKRVKSSIILLPAGNTPVNTDPVTSSTGSEETFTLIRRWLRQCFTNHATCRELCPNPRSGWNPTRLIDLGTGKVPKPRLFVTAGVLTGLPYLTLSHSWGDTTAFTLQDKNLENMLENVPYVDLNRTIQEAMDATLQLGFRFLWVDSLCIIQDSLSDWNREAAVMGQVYAQSSCTIAATGAANGSEGLYFRRNPNLVKPSRIQATLDQRNCDYFVLDDHLWEKEVVSMPLNKRAWVLQEMILSPRIIHFSRNQIFWTCEEDESCESFPLGFPRDGLGPTSTRDNSRLFATIPSRKRHMTAQLQFLITQPNPPWMEMLYGNDPYIHEVPRKLILDKRYENASDERTTAAESIPIRQRRFPNIPTAMWQYIVEDYTRRKFTHAKDRGVAITGIEKEMKKYFNGDYIAGICTTDLPTQLLWVASDHRSNFAVPQRAPSWSWLCIEGPVTCRWINLGVSAPKVKILDFCITTETTTSGALIYQGFIRLRGRLARAGVKNSDPNPEFLALGNIQFLGMVDGSLPPSMYKSDCAILFADDIAYEAPGIKVFLDFPATSENFGEVYLLQLVGVGEFRDTDTPLAVGLVLTKSEKQADFIRRGHFIVSSDKAYSRLIMAFDAFDRSPLSAPPFVETYDFTKLYEITLL